jgi:glutathione S-transferase
MDKLTLQNPLFATYVIAATLMILKAVSMSWLTVVRMLQENGGFRSPEDLRKTPLNPTPDASQLERNERVERIRRIHLSAQTHDLRATLWTVGSLILLFMTVRTLIAALGY